MDLCFLFFHKKKITALDPKHNYHSNNYLNALSLRPSKDLPLGTTIALPSTTDRRLHLPCKEVIFHVIFFPFLSTSVFPFPCRKQWPHPTPTTALRHPPSGYAAKRGKGHHRNCVNINCTGILFVPLVPSSGRCWWYRLGPTGTPRLV